MTDFTVTDSEKSDFVPLRVCKDYLRSNSGQFCKKSEYNKIDKKYINPNLDIYSDKRKQDKKPPLSYFSIKDFYGYLFDTKQSGFHRFALDGYHHIPYVHRFMQAYRNGLLAKLHQLNDWYQRNPVPVTMVTFTTYQTGISFVDQLFLLKDSYRKINKVIRKFGKINYFWVLEPHKSGYIHMHCLYFTLFTDEQKDKINNLWASSYHAGDSKHGVIFEGTIKPSQTLSNVSNYLMKYIGKTFTDQSPGQLQFNTLLWALSKCSDYPGVRMIGSSRELSKIMSWRKEPRDPNKTEFIETYLTHPYSDSAKSISYNNKMTPFTRTYLKNAIHKSIADLNFDID